MRHNEQMTEIVKMENDVWQVGIVPQSGGSVAYARSRVGDAWVDVLRPTSGEDLAKAATTASYPLVPWSNRIRDGKLQWAGRTYQLRINAPDGTAIHGTGTEYPWTVVERDATRVTLEFVSRNYYGVNFPWPFTARCTYALDGDRFTWTTSLTNEAHETFPAGFGHHPYFLRQLAGPDGAIGGDALLELACEQAYPVERVMAIGPAGALPPHLDFRQLRPLGSVFVDDCFTGRTSPTFATIEYPGALTVRIDADELYSHGVVYIPEGKPFFAVEPVTNVNDGFTLEAAGQHGTGVFLIQPAETRGASFSLVAEA